MLLDDKVFLKHILDEIYFIENSVSNVDLDEALKDEILKRAIVRSLEIIGEAAKNVTKDFKLKYPDVEWKRIGATRDKLIHHYFGIDYQVVKEIIIDNLPELKFQIEKIINDTN
jgi:uncharacterized protein with HEPN domain